MKKNVNNNSSFRQYTDNSTTKSNMMQYKKGSTIKRKYLPHCIGCVDMQHPIKNAVA